jgi:hypothetical protein
VVPQDIRLTATKGGTQWKTVEPSGSRKLLNKREMIIPSVAVLSAAFLLTVGRRKVVRFELFDRRRALLREE